MLLTRLCLVMYATPRMLKLLLFCLWPSRIVVPFDRSILIVLKIGLFVNCVDDRVVKYGKYGLYNNNGVLTCGPCGQRLDYTRDDVITTHITRDGHDRKCAAQISHGAQYVLAAGYEEQEKLRQHKAAQAKERAEQRRNPSHSTQPWDKEREKKYRAQLTTENRAKRDRSSQGKERPEAKQNTVLQQVSALVSKHRLVLHLQLTFSSEFGKPIYEFITQLQVDIVPKGNSGGQRTPIGHRLFIRVIELESKLQNWAQDVGLVLVSNHCLI